MKPDCVPHLVHDVSRAEPSADRSRGHPCPGSVDDGDRERGRLVDHAGGHPVVVSDRGDPVTGDERGTTELDGLVPGVRAVDPGHGQDTGRAAAADEQRGQGSVGLHERGDRCAWGPGGPADPDRRVPRPGAVDPGDRQDASGVEVQRCEGVVVLLDRGDRRSGGCGDAADADGGIPGAGAVDSGDGERAGGVDEQGGQRVVVLLARRDRRSRGCGDAADADAGPGLGRAPPCGDLFDEIDR